MLDLEKFKFVNQNKGRIFKQKILIPPLPPAVFRPDCG